MGFSFDFSHVPTLSLPTLPATNTGLSNETISIVDKMTSNPGGLFTNPMVKDTNFLSDAITRIEDHITSIKNGDIVSQTISQSDATSFISSDPFEDVRTSMGNFLMHTGRLSGILKSQGIEQPGLQQILSIGVQMQNMAAIINSGLGCLPVVGGATGLFSQETFQGYTNDLANMLTKLERGAATIADITQLLATISNAIQGIMSKDSQFLQNAVNQLQSAALGLAMEGLAENPCARFVFERISNTNPGGFLNILGSRHT